MNYTLILNMASGYTTCMQCVMESWGSDFSIDTNISEEEAINEIAKIFSETPIDSIHPVKKWEKYTAYLIGLIENSSHSTEQVVYEFTYDEAHVGSYHDDLNDTFVENELKRICDLIRTKQKKILT